MKAFVTKYALSKGIKVYKVKKEHIDAICCVEEHPGLYLHKNEWYKTAEEAIKKAEEMRLKKIQSLQKQLEKLESLTFDIDDSMLK